MTLTLPDIATRASWGARYPDGDLTLNIPAVEVFLHHSVTHQLPATATVAQEREQMRALESVGQSRFGAGISYNVLIFPSGRAYQGVNFNRRGTHTGGRNSTSRSICLAGNYETNHPTNAQIETAARIYHGGMNQLWRTGSKIRGHRDVKSTACPGRHAYARLDDIRAGASFVDNPTKPNPPKPSPGRPGLMVDGRWGSATTMALQHQLGTTADGIVSSQPLRWRDENRGLTTGWIWTRDPVGSRVITAMQERIDTTRDGLIGPDTIGALQRHLSMRVVDGEIWNPSDTVQALQRRLNAGKF